MSKVKAELKGRDTIRANANEKGEWSVSGMGCGEVLELVGQLKAANEDPKNWPQPKGNSHSEILVRELITKVQGNWKFPLEQDELCHCRKVPTQVVDQAIIAGAHSIERVRRQTSANTACGTCKPEVEALLNFRLSKI